MDQGDYLTIEELEQATTHEVELPELSNRLGRRCVLTFRAIGMSDYLTLIPLPPPGSEQWPVTEARTRELEWLRGLAPDEQERARGERNDVVYRTIELAALRPALTADMARRLGNDAMVAFNAILMESGILPRPETPPAATPADAAAV